MGNWPELLPVEVSSDPSLGMVSICLHKARWGRALAVVLSVPFFLMAMFPDRWPKPLERKENSREERGLWWLERKPRLGSNRL